jgi:hypothetical protein
LRGAVAVKGQTSNPGIGVSVDVASNFFEILGAFAFVAATIILKFFTFLLVFAFAVAAVLFWLFPAIAFVLF